MLDVIDDEQLAVWRAFLTAHALATRAISRELAAEGLPDLGWYDLLWSLRRSPNQRLRVNELAREVVLSPTAMSRFVDRAVAAGVVAREPDPDDRRAQRIELTDEGRRAVERIRDAGARGMQVALADWSPEELRRLATLFHRMVDDFVAHAADEETGARPAAPA